MENKTTGHALDKIKIHQKTGLAYFPEQIRKEGCHHEVEFLPNAITLTLIKPGSSMEDVKRSLQNVLRDIDLRIKYPPEVKNDSPA